MAEPRPSPTPNVVQDAPEVRSDANPEFVEIPDGPRLTRLRGGPHVRPALIRSDTNFAEGMGSAVTEPLMWLGTDGQCSSEHVRIYEPVRVIRRLGPLEVLVNEEQDFSRLFLRWPNRMCDFESPTRFVQIRETDVLIAADLVSMEDLEYGNGSWLRTRLTTSVVFEVETGALLYAVVTSQRGRRNAPFNCVMAEGPEGTEMDICPGDPTSARIDARWPKPRIAGDQLSVFYFRRWHRFRLIEHSLVEVR